MTDAPKSQDMDMVYVAIDPSQPGTAYAICVDDKKYLSNTAEFILSYTKKGAQIRRVTCDEGLAMIDKWIRPNVQGKLL